jgi:phage gp46-like protein
LDLQTLTITSLFCDAPAKPGDDVGEGQPRRGWWGDAYAEDGDAWGSRLWLLGRAKLTRETVKRATEYMAEALRWMVTDGLASKIEPRAEIAMTPAGRAIVGYVDIYAPGDKSATTYGPWDLLRGGA